jgi:2-methylcitrate dehydratase PrpD
MQWDAEVDVLYPKRCVGKLTATSTLGRTLEARVDEPKGDPGNTLTPDEIEANATPLGTFREGATASTMRAVMRLGLEMDTLDRDADILEALG